MKKILPTVDAASVVNLPRFDDTGSLVVAEAGDRIPFVLRRMFSVTGVPAGTKRGGHAHRRCHQLMICAAGAVNVVVADELRTRTIALDAPDKALHVPPGLWVEQTYRDPATVLTVLCDRPYEADDYIRDVKAFASWRQENLAES